MFGKLFRDFIKNAKKSLAENYRRYPVVFSGKCKIVYLPSYSRLSHYEISIFEVKNSNAQLGSRIEYNDPILEQICKTAYDAGQTGPFFVRVHYDNDTPVFTQVKETDVKYNYTSTVTVNEDVWQKMNEQINQITEQDDM